MPARRRHREARRRMRLAVAEAVERDRQEFQTAVRSARSHHLDDEFWLEHERGDWCCIDCHPNHPDRLRNDALSEIRTYKERAR
jgi:hypothetical protein